MVGRPRHREQGEKPGCQAPWSPWPRATRPPSRLPTGALAVHISIFLRFPDGTRYATLPDMARRILAALATLLLLPILPAGSARAAPPAQPAAPGAPGPVFRWPLAGSPTVTRPFQPPPRPWLPGHRGVDLAGTSGATVFAAGPGVVAYAGEVAGTGVLTIDHLNGLRTTYEPVAPLVRAGQPVEAGQPIGTLLPGHPGCPVAACLHWGLRRGAEYLDPLALLRAGRVRLLPLDGSGGLPDEPGQGFGEPLVLVRPVVHLGGQAQQRAAAPAVHRDLGVQFVGDPVAQAPDGRVAGWTGSRPGQRDDPRGPGAARVGQLGGESPRAAPITCWP